MLKKIFKGLDKWIDEQNVERRDEGMLSISACEIKVIGQTALLEAEISLQIPATMKRGCHKRPSTRFSSSESG